MAYAAVQYLMHILEQMMGADPNWVLHNKQQIESLQEKVSFLRDFLEEFSLSTSETVKDLEIRIRDAAYNVEDIIESYVCDQILSESDEKLEERGYQNFFQDLEKAIEETRFVKEVALEIRRKMLELNYVQRGDRSRPNFSGKGTTMVGFDDELLKIKDWLTSSSSKLEVISIVGMGGIGKTTLARNVFDDGLIVYHFHNRSWATVSQEYQVHDILAELLLHSTRELGQESEEELAERLYKSLKGKTYLIVMDDLWEAKAWDDVKRLFLDDNNGSRIILTTRLTDVGVHAASSNYVLKMRFLKYNESWDLLCNKVFGEESRPHYLVGIGQEIAKLCQGFPLSIVVVGGLLSMDKTVGYWETIASSVNSLLTTGDSLCSKILSLSYHHLPAHLKPCYLYFAVFPEDYDIRRSKLIKLWVAEGFLKPKNSNSLEDVAERCLEDLVNRSLIMVFKLGYGGKVKTYRIHDLLRDFCITEVQKEKFFDVTNRYIPIYREGIRIRKRVCIHPNFPSEDCFEYIFNSNGPGLLTRSLLCSSYTYLSACNLAWFRLLRILDISRIRLFGFPIEVLTLVLLRYLSLRCYKVTVPATISSIWGLQTLVIETLGDDGCYIILPEVWKMPRLRHVLIGEFYLPDPTSSGVGGENFVCLTDLQTLSTVRNFKFTVEITKRIPELNKLKVFYDVEFEDWPLYHLSNIVCLNKLETLEFTSRSKTAFPPNFKFPEALKKLSLSGCLLPWADLTMVGSLPNLEVLILRGDSCEGGVWEPNEGEFCELKFLQIYRLELVHWRADDSHFRKLKCLDISYCSFLEEIPIEIGNIETLEWIKLDGCIPSAVTSAQLILDQQRSFGNDDLQVYIE